MERIIRVATVFAINTIVSILAIVIANGELTWATAGLVLVVALVLGALVGIWAVVHGQFETAVEVGLTIGIFVALIAAFVIAMIAGSDIKKALGDLFEESSAWWLVSPLGGTAAIVFLFGLHRERR
ncbi:MAG TPA: hypothetical protein VGE13_03950 [Candidatus Saccharimonadales bacterium]